MNGGNQKKEMNQMGITGVIEKREDSQDVVTENDGQWIDGTGCLRRRNGALRTGCGGIAP